MSNCNSGDYGSLSNYHNAAPISACTTRLVVPSFGTPPGFNTGYCRASPSACPCTQDGLPVSAMGSASVGTGGYQKLKNAYPQNCAGACGSQYIQKLCG